MMLYRPLADIVVLLHLAFVIFAALGGLLSIRWRHVIWLHAPAVLWATLVELAGWCCPLTPLENFFRFKGGEAGYSGGFVAHHILPVLYPASLTRGIQIALGLFVMALNLSIYGYVFARRRRKKALGAR